MNIYFACSVTGGRADEPIFQQLVTALQEQGHYVPTALLASPDVMPLEGVILPSEVYARDVDWINGCDLLLAEVSTPSHGVGYEIGYALSLRKKVLCLHRESRKVSKMILGNPDPQLTVMSYKTPEQALRLLQSYMDGMQGGAE